jgi:hypothetical protein
LVQFDPNEPPGFLCIHSESENIDPYANSFTFPEDTLRFSLFDHEGMVRWRKNLGNGIIPGVWFCPVFPFDLDDDGAEEIWYVDTEDSEHPLSLDGHRLARLNPASGERTGMWEWPNYPREELGQAYRNFILGGHADETPVLVTAQGIYDEMKLQGWDPGVERRWEYRVAPDAPGARGSHMTPVLDIDDDGVDELFWGERLIELDTGNERCCAGLKQWDGHSDTIQPTLDIDADEWYLYTTREPDKQRGRWRQSPRVVTFDEDGERVWSAIEEGHMHTGFTARIGEDGGKIAMAGRTDDDREFYWTALDGEPVDFDYSLWGMKPVDIDGDGTHELFGDGQLRDADGTVLAEIDDEMTVRMFSKLVDHPGEQIVTATEQGRIRVWGDRNAQDGPVARTRYEHPYYRKAQRLSAVGYNGSNLGGL